MKKLLIVMLVVAAGAVAQRSSDAERDLEAAVNKEVVQGDVNGAIQLYRRILSRYGSQREIAARALLHLGQSHEKLGQGEARKSYERIVKEFADQKELAAQARARLSWLGGAPAEGGVRVRRVFEASMECGALSQDEQWATHVRKGDLYIRNMATGKETPLQLPQTASDDDLVGRVGTSKLSSDGQWVAYATHLTYPNNLWLTAVNGSVHRKLQQPGNVNRSAALAFAPGDRMLLVYFELEGSSGGEMWLYSVPGGEGHKLYASRNLRWAGPAVFSPDGQFVVFRPWNTGSTETPASVISIKGGEPWALPAQPDETPVGFTADGKLVFHSPQRGGTPSLWTLPLRQGRAEGQPQLLARGVPKDFGGHYNASGKYYYSLSANRFELLTAQLSGTSTRPATNRDQGQGVSPDYSRDGKFLAFLNRDREKVIVRNLESGAETVHHSSLS